MTKVVKIELTEKEIKDLIFAVKMELSREIDVLKDNNYQPESEVFCVFLDDVREKVDLYIKLRESIAELDE